MHALSLQSARNIGFGQLRSTQNATDAPESIVDIFAGANNAPYSEVEFHGKMDAAFSELNLKSVYNPNDPNNPEFMKVFKFHYGFGEVHENIALDATLNAWSSEIEDGQNQLLKYGLRASGEEILGYLLPEGSLDAIKKGSIFNDAPEGIPKMGWYMLKHNILSTPNSNFSETEKSHYGIDQWYHSMTPDAEMTNVQSKAAIVFGLSGWYQEALNKQGTAEGFLILNKIGHAVADAYSGAHITRDAESGKITAIHDYNGAGQEFHSEYDKKYNLPEIKAATNSVTAINVLYKNNASVDSFKQFLENVVYSIQPGYEETIGASIPIAKKSGTKL